MAKGIATADVNDSVTMSPRIMPTCCWLLSSGSTTARTSVVPFLYMVISVLILYYDIGPVIVHQEHRRHIIVGVSFPEHQVELYAHFHGVINFTQLGQVNLVFIIHLVSLVQFAQVQSMRIKAAQFGEQAIIPAFKIILVVGDDGACQGKFPGFK